MPSNTESLCIQNPENLSSFSLSPEELKFFNENGYIGPFTFLETTECDALTEIIDRKIHLRPVLTMRWSRSRIKYLKISSWLRKLFKLPPPSSTSNTRPIYWYKSAHLLVKEAADLALRKEILGRIKSILGNNILLWGTQLVRKKNNESHPWHSDIEHVEWNGVTVWIGLQNVGPDSTMKLITGSHLFKTTPQELYTKSSCDLNSDQEVLKLAQNLSNNAKLVTLDLRPGEFFIFSGNTWHASVNSSGRRRSAMICQFSKTDQRIRIPISFNLPVEWDPRQPWVMLASGMDTHHLNHIKINPKT